MLDTFNAVGLIDQNAQVRQDEPDLSDTISVTMARALLVDGCYLESIAAPAAAANGNVSGRRVCHDALIAHQRTHAWRAMTCESEFGVASSLANRSLVRVLPGYGGENVPFYAVCPSNRSVPAQISVLAAELAKTGRPRRALRFLAC